MADLRKQVKKLGIDSLLPDWKPPANMRQVKRIIVKVIGHSYIGASRYTGYIAKTIWLHLACGHEAFRKASAGVPNKARCRECEQKRLQNEMGK